MNEWPTLPGSATEKVEEKIGSFYCLGIRGECPGCHQVTELVETPSMTAYADDSLNRPFWACSECSGEYVQMMQEQWAGYWSGLL